MRELVWSSRLGFATVPPLLAQGHRWRLRKQNATAAAIAKRWRRTTTHFKVYHHVKSRLRRLTTRVALVLPALLACVATLGCADGPIPEMRSLNPWVREQWAEDEKHGPTFYSRIERLNELRLQASSTSPSDRERISSELAAILKDEPSPTMRAEILRAMAAYPSAATLPAVEAAMADADAQVRVTACNALGKWKMPEAMQALGNAVGSDSDLDVRIAAARGLENFNDPAAIKALSVALDDNDPALQKVAMSSLKQSTGKDYGNSVPAWREYLAGGNPKPPPPVSIATQLQDWLWW
jgi:hypothetical protein